MNEQERARCIECEITEAILEVIEKRMIKTREAMRMVRKEGGEHDEEGDGGRI